MGMVNRNPDVPLEAVLKWLKKDRDKLQAKLDMLVPYTKRLEKKLETQRVEIEREKDAEIAKLRKQLENTDKQWKLQMHDNAQLIKDYKQSEWYKCLKKQNKSLRDECKKWKIIANRSVSALFSPEQLKEEVEDLNESSICEEESSL